MIVLKSPDKYVRGENDLMVFLAGGITKCEDWQEKVIEELGRYHFDDNVIVMSPRCETFDITDKNASRKQIEWEFKYLSDMDLFSMYFCNSESVQPICMYELGRYISDMSHRFPFSIKDRVLVGVEHGYSREQDVLIQTRLAFDCNDMDVVYNNITPEKHAQYLAMKIKHILDNYM